MSEYQHYEFLAVDEPLTEKQMREVRSFSTRARITPTSFVNVYKWGDFKGNINDFMTKYYDAFVYAANWGTHTLSFRLPKAEIDVSVAKQYCCRDYASLRLRGEYAILTLQSEDEGGGWEEGEGWMSSLVPLRADLLAGDLRCLYLGWLQVIAPDEIGKDEPEPPVPPGLGDLTAPLRALADFLRIDRTLLDAAAEASPSLQAQTDSPEEVTSWIESLPSGDKDSMLYRLIQEPAVGVQREILRRFRLARESRQTMSKPARRTAGELLAAWNRLAEEKRRQAAKKRSREEARRQKAAARARKKRLDELASREPQAWRQVDSLVQTKQPKQYDAAVQLLRDLSDLADREGRADEATARLAALREEHCRKPSLLRRLDAAKL